IKINNIITISSIIYFIMVLLVTFLPLYYVSNESYIYSYGPATNVLLTFGALTVLFDLFCLFKNIKEIKIKKYYPLFVFILLTAFTVVIRITNPGLTIINSCFAFITILMFFTIENPDFKVIKELTDAKETSERSNNNKSTFIFNVVQKLR